MPFSHFLTSVCAIIGGVFTVLLFVYFIPGWFVFLPVGGRHCRFTYLPFFKGVESSD
jgi:hypothetical protein